MNRYGKSVIGTLFSILFAPLLVGVALARDWCVPPDPDYCVSRVCGEGEGDCDPGQCGTGLVCVNDVGANYGLPDYYDVCEAAGGAHPDPDYCVNNTCGIGEGDCDPGQCDEGTCVADVGENYGLPAHYDVCEAEPAPPADSGVGQFTGTWEVTSGQTMVTYTFGPAEPCWVDLSGAGLQCVQDYNTLASLGPDTMTGYTTPYAYALIHADGQTCRAFFLQEPTDGMVEGDYGEATGSCLDPTVVVAIAQQVYSGNHPSTGMRIQ